ncbi:hypothetical protein E4U19_000967 [Claviceps sp. Clav32 group G5]|nr:hypothetical protein E4U19_000967 [Claviceps sp. Clav32 group G5]
MKRGGKQREELLQEVSPPIQLPQPLPPIPEVYKSTMTPKLFGKLLERMRKESESSIVSNAAAAAAFTVSSAASTRDRNVSKQSSEARPHAARSSQQRNKRKGSSLKSQISDPTLNRVGSFPLGLSLHQGGPPGPAFEDGPSIESMPSPVGTFPDSATGSCHDQSRRPDTSFQFTLAPPRLSPMEYVRMYMLHQADAQRSGQKCLLPPPQKQWFWTPKWEEFLIIPRIPPAIKRGGLPEHVNSPKDRTSSVQFLRFSELPASSFGHVRPVTGCPRLSLHLGGLTTLMPSVMNLTSLGMSRAVDSYELGSIPRTTSRRLSMSSDGRRTSLTTLAENEAWTPSPWDDVPGFFANADTHSARQPSCASLAVRREVSAHSDPRAWDTSSPTCSDDLSPPIDGSIRPAFKAFIDSSESLHPLPLFFGNRSAQNTNHIVSSTVQCKPLQVEDGLTPGRIQSVVATLMDEGDDDVDSDASHSTLACEHSPGILVTSSQPGSGTGNDIDQRNYPTETTPTTRKSQNRSPRLEGNRRHSLDPHTPIYSHTRRASLESVLDQTAHSLISPSISSSSCFFDDPFFDPRNDLSPWYTSPQQPHPQTPHTPIPDSPTLGQGRVHVANDLNRHTRDMPTDRTSPPLQSHQPRTSDRTGHTARHGYSSSFALNRAKSHEAFTLLPRLSSSRNYDTRMGAVQEDGQVPRSGRSAEALVSDRTTALALRDHDTASRLTSAVVSHHFQLAVDSNRAASATRKGKGKDGHGAGHRKTATFGSLLAKHGRRRSCSSSSNRSNSNNNSSSSNRSNSSKPVGLFENGLDADTNLESTGENQRSSLEPDSSLNVSGPLLLLQRAKQLQGGDASGASHASHSTSSSLAGLKEKWRLKTGHARS